MIVPRASAPSTAEGARLRVAVLGCTGSIGTQTLDVCRHHPERVEVVALSADSSTEALVTAAREFGVSHVAVADASHAHDTVLDDLPTGCALGVGPGAVTRLAALPEVDVVVNALVGFAGIHAGYEALLADKVLAYANKESIVCGGDLLMPLVRPGRLIPVDSEHSAIFQCLVGERHEDVRRIWLTCSGGPFYGRTRSELEHVTVADALAHPTWSMGAKITVDSATLMNKGLEFIEAMHLYHMPPEKISIVIHRESIIHSLVEYCDNAMIAQLGTPDMRLPIQYALTWPERIPGPASPLDLWNCGPLTFGTPDLDTFRCLPLALEAARTGGTAGAILNGANEAAVARFLEGKIGFLDIAEQVARAMDQVPVVQRPTLEDILEADRAARAV